MKIVSFFQLLAFVVLFNSAGVMGQSSDTPRNCGQNINSEYSEINPVISPDGKVLFFSRVNHPENNYGREDSQDIWYAELQEDGTWSKATRLPAPLNQARYNAVLSISADGNTMLINGIYNKKHQWARRGLSVARKTGGSWGAPETLKVKAFSRKNRGVSSNAFLSPDGQVLLLNFTKKFNGKKLNIYYSQQKNGKWRKPKKLPKPVSTRRSEEAPFLSADGRTLYFSRDNGRKDYDIYYTKRLDATWKNWSEPALLKDSLKINTREWESYFKTNAKGSRAWFASTASGSGKADIFEVRLFEENPFIIISGSVINNRTHKPLTGGYVIFINDVKSDSVKVNPETGRYEVKLPLGKSYSLKAVAEHCNSEVSVADASSVKVFTKMEKDLNVDPLDYVVLEGNLFVKDDNTVIPDTSAVAVYLDNVMVDSAIVDRHTGKYKMQVPFGSSHTIEMKADKYKSHSQPLDLSEVKEFTRMKKDLYVERIPVVKPASTASLVSGRIVDSKTGKALPESSTYEVQVDGVTAPAEINKATGEYALSLPFGKKYTINASASGYYPVYEAVDLSGEKPEAKISRDLAIAPIEVGQSIKINNILFETGKAKLKEPSFAELDKVVKFLKDNPTINIEINGHTDNVGNADANLKLSNNRALSVAEYIVGKGIARERVRSKGYGMTKPVDTNKTPAGRGKNRRVEFTILDK